MIYNCSPYDEFDQYYSKYIYYLVIHSKCLVYCFFDKYEQSLAFRTYIEKNAENQELIKVKPNMAVDLSVKNVKTDCGKEAMYTYRYKNKITGQVEKISIFKQLAGFDTKPATFPNEI